MKNLLFNSRFINFSPVENAPGPDSAEQTKKDLNALVGPDKGVSKDDFDDFIDEQTKETAEEGKIAVNKAKKVTRMKEIKIVGNIVDENGNVNSKQYITNLAEKKGMKIEDRLLPFLEQTDRHLSDNNPLDKVLGKGMTEQIINQLSTAYSNLIDAGNYEALRDFAYDVDAMISDFYVGYKSAYKTTDRANLESYERADKESAKDLQRFVEKAAA